ncbi:unnamed protein product [Ectocarpus sp. 6 AP-2014]
MSLLFFACGRLLQRRPRISALVVSALCLILVPVDLVGLVEWSDRRLQSERWIREQMGETDMAGKRRLEQEFVKSDCEMYDDLPELFLPFVWYCRLWAVLWNNHASRRERIIEYFRFFGVDRDTAKL